MFGWNFELLVFVVVVFMFGGCFDVVIEGVWIVLKYCMLVFVLLDVYLVNGFELWFFLDVELLLEIIVEFVK